MRIFIMSPANCATGGPELLQQFARCLMDNGIEAYMLYPDAEGTNCPIPEVYWKYHTKYVSKYVDREDSVLVLAETMLHYMDLCQKGTVMVWWLSVNNYILTYKSLGKQNDWDVFGLKSRENLVHFVQSYYAKDFIYKCMGITNAYYLKDYINSEILEYASSYGDICERKNICLYNPKKGYEKLLAVIKACRKDIIWMPLNNYTPLEMAELMCHSKLYIDFGPHPGKDRIPREAAICGCCVLTNREGSAAYWEDVGIPESYKIKDSDNVTYVLEKIYDLIDHYEERTQEYSDYRQKIRQEKEKFLRETLDAIIILKAHIKDVEETGCNTKVAAEQIKMLESLQSAVIQMEELLCEAKDACLNNCTSKTIDKLLTLDYLIQVARESIYIELTELASLRREK